MWAPPHQLVRDHGDGDRPPQGRRQDEERHEQHKRDRRVEVDLARSLVRARQLMREIDLPRRKPVLGDPSIEGKVPGDLAAALRAVEYGDQLRGREECEGSRDDGEAHGDEAVTGRHDSLWDHCGAVCRGLGPEANPYGFDRCAGATSGASCTRKHLREPVLRFGP